ncbi:MAG TPA: hypothetical protein VH477_06335 [Bryobacteraceae bacterium]|jgi:ABC-type phosphate transport system substrate-binding protein
MPALFKTWRPVLLLAALLGCPAAHAATDDLAIIANPRISLNELSRDDLARIFLMTKTSLQGVGRVEPVLERAGVAHEAFLKNYIGRSDSALMTYYRSLLFTGKGNMPKSFASESELIDYVAKTTGAIGYVSVPAATAAVKVLKVK